LHKAAVTGSSLPCLIWPGSIVLLSGAVFPGLFSEAASLAAGFFLRLAGAADMEADRRVMVFHYIGNFLAAWNGFVYYNGSGSSSKEIPSKAGITLNR
jgi:hypothetical protein